MSIEIKQITKYYGRQKALDRISFTVHRGEMAGFLGPNGAGKSTLMKIITGYLPSDDGEVWINGQKMDVHSVELKREIGYLPENNPLYNDLYIKEYLEFVAGIYGIKRQKPRIDEMMALTGLGAERHKKIGALSKGYRQRVGLAQALLHDPSILILDEPTSGLDPNQLDEIRSLIANISREKTVLLSSHILREIEAICRRVVIIHHGALVADRKIDALLEGSNSGQQIFVAFDKPVEAAAINAVKGVGLVSPAANGWLVTALPGNDIRGALFHFAVQQQLTLLALTEQKENLEQLFRQLTTGAEI